MGNCDFEKQNVLNLAKKQGMSMQFIANAGYLKRLVSPKIKEIIILELLLRRHQASQQTYVGRLRNQSGLPAAEANFI